MPDWNQIIYKSGDFFLPPSVKKVLDLSIYKSYNYSLNYVSDIKAELDKNDVVILDIDFYYGAWNEPGYRTPFAKTPIHQA